MSGIKRDQVLEAELSFAIAKVLEKYEKKTGLIATNIYVRVANRKGSDTRPPQWTISGVRVDLDDPREEKCK